MEIIPWNEEDKDSALSYLEKHSHCSMFLLGNLERYGPTMGDAVNSGQYWIIRDGNEIRGVFSLTKRGNALFHVDVRILEAELCEDILDRLVTQPAPISGLLGNWEAINVLATAFVYNGIWQDVSQNMREISYSLDDLSPFQKQESVRFLTPDDYPRWRKFRMEYLLECNLSLGLREDQLKDGFMQDVKSKLHWGYCVNKQLLAIASLNGRYRDIAQVGGVYTSPECRGSGFAQAIIKQQLFDIREQFKGKKAVLFTNKENIVAQKTYEKIGFKQRGLFGMIFP